MTPKRRYRISQLTFLFLLLAGCISYALNFAGTIEMPGIDDTYVVEVNEGTLKGRQFQRGAAEFVQEWIKYRTEAETRPLVIWWQQIWYNTITSGYELEIWVQPKDGYTQPLYALYQSENTIYLRVEYEGRNRVLRANFTSQELEEALQSYLR